MTRQIQDCYIVAARRTAVGKAPRGEVWLTSNITVTRTTEPGKRAEGPHLPATPPVTEDVAPGTPFTLPEAEARAHVERFGGELL